MDQCNKESIRKKYLIVRSKLLDRDIKSNRIINKIKECDKYKEAKRIGFFKHIGSEVDLDELIVYSLNNNKIVYLPRVLDDTTIEFYRINSLSDLKHISNYGILEPDIINESATLDLIIVPGIVFDKRGYRIGYGKGYYDRYLLNKNIYKIGVTYKECYTDYIENDSHDIKMDMVLTG